MPGCRAVKKAGLSFEGAYDNSMELMGKVAIVTGASSGIGLATAKLLSGEGARVALVARSKDKLDALAKETPGSFVVVADMSKEDEVKRMVETVCKHFGRVDILVNNAGRGYDASLEKTDAQEYRDLFELDVVGPLIAMQMVIPIMRKNGGGAIINISSGTALMHLPNMAAYSSLKRALVGISLTANEELAKDKITVGVVYPYITLTKFEDNTIKGHALPQEREEGGSPFEADTAEHVAQCIVTGIKSGDAEIFAHDWMKKMAAGK